MKAVALAVVLAALFAAPAHAQVAPTVVRFDMDPDPMMFDSPTGCPSSRVLTGGRDGGPFLRVPCGSPQLRIRFFATQRVVEFFVRAPQGGSDLLVQACDFQFCDGSVIAERTLTPAPTGWMPVVIEDPTGGARIDNVVVSIPAVSAALPIDIDDVSFSPSDQPDTTISSSATAGSSARFGLGTNHPLGGSFTCALDGAGLTPCPSPFTVNGLAPGAHTFAAAAVDVYGRADATPATSGFTIAAPPPPAPPVDTDRDGVADTSDNCPAAANADQADADADGIGNACELLPAGNVAPVAGVTTIVRQISGEVFVKLPGRGLAQSGSGFIPLKGVAAIPIGSTVDARKGELEVESAANGYAANDRRLKRQRARIKAGMFAIRQQRAKRSVAKKASIPTDVGLLSPPGAEATCQRGPSKGIVRSVSMVVKGYYRALAGATTATVRSATFATTDRCDGTLTEVGRGRVSLKLKGRAKPVVVRAGAAYFAKARLFAARKGRPAGP